ncbi:PAS domain-containing protein [Nannocystis pusilla]|uniref:PAS domain-containing protein n=1 Tax=Nannocystis pusilla TaxID=889268 RepID=UPI003B7E7C45
MVGLDLELRVTEWNESAEQLLGVTREEAVGRSVAELVPLRGGTGELSSRTARRCA